MDPSQVHVVPFLIFKSTQEQNGTKTQFQSNFTSRTQEIEVGEDIPVRFDDTQQFIQRELSMVILFLTFDGDG